MNRRTAPPAVLLIGFALFAIGCTSSHSVSTRFDASIDANTGKNADSGEDAQKGTDEDPCECEDGRYSMVYKYIDGDCAGTTFYTIPIEYRYSQIGKWKLDEIYQAIYRQTTEISYHGCSMSLVFQVRNRDNLVFHVQGQLDIDDTTRLSGRVLRTEFNDDQSIKCQGNYDIVLTKTAELDVNGVDSTATR